MAVARIWFDLENTPHVHFLRPLIEGVLAAGAEVRISARPQAQTLELAAFYGLNAEAVGGGDRRGSFAKVAGVLSRATRLLGWTYRGLRPDVLVSCSRSACVAARLRGIPSVVVLDYEHAEQRTLSLADVIWMPDVLRDAVIPRSSRRVVAFFEGLKENLYLDAACIDRPDARASLGVTANEFFVITRPPAESAHYASDASWQLWLTVARRLGERPNARVLVMPRTSEQGKSIQSALQDLRSVDVLDRVVDGPVAVAAADLVVGGGGTINREAAVLGTPVWSVFSGPRPHVDEVLAREGRLTWIVDQEAARSIEPPVGLARRPRGPFPAGRARLVEDILQRARQRGRRSDS